MDHRNTYLLRKALRPSVASWISIESEETTRRSFHMEFLVEEATFSAVGSFARKQNELENWIDVNRAVTTSHSQFILTLDLSAREPRIL